MVADAVQEGVGLEMALYLVQSGTRCLMHQYQHQVGLLEWG